MPTLRATLLALALPAVAAPAAAQETRYPLATAAGLRLHDVKAEPATLDGRAGLRVTMADETLARLPQLSPQERAAIDQLVVVEGTDFSSGVIEAEVAGAPGPGADEAARGFVGIAFRVQPDLKTYDAFYLRPTNGRAADPERRSHATQYVSHPAWPWFRLRQESPGKYEAPADLVPGAWTRVRIEVRGARARLFVNDDPRPALVVDDVKSGPDGRGAVALWLGPGTVAHFRDLRVEALPGTR